MNYYNREKKFNKEQMNLFEVLYYSLNKNELKFLANGIGYMYYENYKTFSYNIWYRNRIVANILIKRIGKNKVKFILDYKKSDLYSQHVDFETDKLIYKLKGMIHRKSII